MLTTMYKAQLAAAVLLAVTATIESKLAPAGSCDLYNIKPVDLDFDRLGQIPKWDYLYTTDAEPFRKLDHESIDVISVGPGQKYKTDDTKVLKDKTATKNKSTYTLQGNIGYESSVDDKGNVRNFRVYPLATTESDAVLYYRCAEKGSGDVDTRYVVVPAGKSITDDELEVLYEADKNYPFRGPLYKLPRQYDKEL